MQIIDNKALLLVTRKADQIKALIPRSEILARNGDQAQVLVNWAEDECRILRNLRIKNLPSPILGRYQWPGVFTPFAHQRETAAFMATHNRCLVLSEAGVGKSASAAWAADYLMTKGQVRRVLIVCPVSIMDTAWRADLFRTVMHRTVGIATGSRERREQIVNGDYEFVIINYDGVPIVQNAIHTARFDLIVCDEASNLKNVSTRRWKAVAALIRPDTRLWLMTGTPAAQSPVDAYGLAKLINPDAVPQFESRFRDQVMVKVSRYRWISRPEAQAVVHNLLQPAIRFTKAECLDLPDLLYTTREVPLTAQQIKFYEQIRKTMVATAAGEQITAVNAAGLLNKLLQVSAASTYSTERGVVDFDATPRIQELLDVIAQTSQKVIVFIAYRHVLERVQSELVKANVSNVAINGSTPEKLRATYIKQFQNEDDPKVILLIPQAAAHGVTLTRADTVVWWGPVASVEMYLQGNARAHRTGQRHPVTVVRLQGSSVERRMYALLDGKVDMHQGLVDLYKQEIA